MKKIILNPDQEKAVSLIKEFLKSDDTDFVLKGRGGTGKTTCIKEVFKKINKQGNEILDYDVAGVCVSHQAKLNLMKSIPDSMTYARAANLNMNFNDLGEIEFVPQTNSFRNNLVGYKKIVFDECSMVTREMEQEIKKYAGKEAKFIWLGDHHQLPPINNEERDGDSHTFNFKWQFELTKKMRQNDNDEIAKLSDEICNYIDTPELHNQGIKHIYELKNSYSIETKKGYAKSNLTQVISSYVRNFRNYDDIRITSFHNERVKEINKLVRKELWNTNEKFIPGELIVMTDQFGSNDDVSAYNGQYFIVENIKKGKILDIECDILQVKDKNDVLYLPVPTGNGMVNYKHKVSDLKFNAIKDKRKWDLYLDFVSRFAFVTYGYCVTNYKIQGTTLKGCYVDWSDIMSVGPLTPKRKLQAFYVGISRPTDYLAIF